MAADDLTRFTQDEEFFGENVARTKRIISKLLLDWTTGDGGTGKHADHLGAISFDKLAELFCRIWDELNRQHKTRYGSAFKRRRGFHGPGRAIRINRSEEERLGVDPGDHRRNNWAFTTEIVEKLKPALGNARMLFTVKGIAWQSSCKISPAIDPTQWEAWLSDDIQPNSPHLFLTPIELRYVEDISTILCSLTSKELRVLGTHHCASETVEDLKFNLDAWNTRFEKLMGKPRGNEVDKASYQLVTTMRELRAKSIENRAIYKVAFTKAMACNHGDVRSALQTIQKTAPEIWDDGVIKRFRSVADALLWFSIYVRRGFCELNLTPKLTAKENKESEKIYPLLVKPLPNLVLDLKDYSNIQGEGFDKWKVSVREAKTTLYSFLPVLNDLSEIGIP